MEVAVQVARRAAGIACWLVGTLALLELTLGGVGSGSYLDFMVFLVRVPIFLMIYIAALIVTSPLLWLVWGDPVERASATKPDDLGALPTELRRLVSSARTIGVALEAPDDGAFRAAWRWQGELGRVSEADRRQLDRAGLGKFDVSPLAETGTLGGWTARRAAKRLRLALAEFERRVLASGFGHPYR